MISGYARLLVFILLLLMSLQLPALFDQYQQRLTAKLAQTQQSLSGFQETANKHFKGDLKALIETYRTSSEPAFSEQSASVADLYRQSVQLQMQVDAIKAPWLQQLMQLPYPVNRPVLQETLQQFSYNGAIPQMVIAQVAVSVFVGLLVLEALLLSIVFLLSYIFVVPKRVKR